MIMYRNVTIYRTVQQYTLLVGLLILLHLHWFYVKWKDDSTGQPVSELRT